MTDDHNSMDVFKRLMRMVKPHWWRLLFAMISMGFVAASTSAVAYLIKPLLDEVFIARDEYKLKLIPVLVLTVFVVKGVFSFTQSWWMNFVGMDIVRELRERLYRHIQSLSLSFFHKNPTGVLISRIINDVNLIQEAVSNFVTSAVMDFFTMVGLVCVIIYQDWRLAILGLLVIPLGLYPIYYFGRRLRGLATDNQVVTAGMTGILSETFHGTRIVKAFNMEEYENKRFISECRRAMRILMGIVKMRTLSATLMETLGGFCIAAIVWYGGYSVMKGHSTPGAFLSFLTALLLLYEPVKRLTRMNAIFQQGISAAVRVFDILDLEPEIQDAPHAISLHRAAGEIEFRDVMFGYDDVPVLKQINLKVKAGEILAIVGTSGGGKTTLVNMIPRFFDVQEGAVLIDGVDVRHVSLKSLRDQIAIVSQNVILFDDSVRHNIAYGSLDRSDEEILAAAQASYAHDFIMAMPKGYDTMIGERGVRLSGGEQQRLAMARALLKDAPILILDEATSNLDTESELAVQRALENLMRGRTTLVIAHRLSTIRHADRIIAISRGRIVEEGNHDELMALDGEYRRLYDMQFQTDDGLRIGAKDDDGPNEPEEIERS